MRQIAIMISLVATIAVTAAAHSVEFAGPNTKPCQSALELSTADGVKVTVKDLFNRKIVTAGDLIAIRNGHNPLSNKHNSIAYSFSDVVDSLISNAKNNPAIKVQLDAVIANVLNDNRQQGEVRSDTKQVFMPMTMNYVTVDTPADGVTTSFYAANVPVTQWQYAVIEKKNPSKFKDGPDAHDVVIDGVMISMLANNPVETVSWNETQEFIAILNQMSKDDDPRIYKIISNHIRHAHIRLLTNAEWQYIITNRGMPKGDYPDGVTPENIGDYAWYIGNADGRTHPVAELRPFYLDGKPYYDLLGNVREMVQDSIEMDFKFIQKHVYRAIRGGSYDYGAGNLRFGTITDHSISGSNSERTSVPPSEHWAMIGFRLAEDPP